MNIRCALAVLLLNFTLVNVSQGGVFDSDTEHEANIDAFDNAGNKASSDSGVVGADVEMTGYAIINGEVWIDGVKIHKPRSVYVSRKNGKTYHIRWGKNGNTSVTEE